MQIERLVALKIGQAQQQRCRNSDCRGDADVAGLAVGPFVCTLATTAGNGLTMKGGPVDGRTFGNGRTIRVVENMWIPSCLHPPCDANACKSPFDNITTNKNLPRLKLLPKIQVTLASTNKG